MIFTTSKGCYPTGAIFCRLNNLCDDSIELNATIDKLKIVAFDDLCSACLNYTTFSAYEYAVLCSLVMAEVTTSQSISCRVRYMLEGKHGKLDNRFFSRFNAHPRPYEGNRT